MKKKGSCLCARMGLAVGTASAQLEVGLSYDPTNYHNALLRYYQLQQHLFSCRRVYGEDKSQLTFAMQMPRTFETCPLVTAQCFPSGEM